MPTDPALASRILNGSISYWNQSSTQAMLSRVNVQFTASTNSTVDFSTNTVYLSSIIASNVDLYTTFVHEVDHLARGSSPYFWSKAFSTPNNFALAVFANIRAEASAIAALVISTNGVQPGQWFGLYATNAEITAAAERASTLMPSDSSFYHSVLTDEIASAITTNSMGYSLIATRVARIWNNHFKIGESSTPSQPANTVAEVDHVAIGNAVTLAASIASLGEIESITVVILPNGKKAIIVERPDGTKELKEVDDNEGTSFFWEFTSLPLEALTPGWYLNVPNRVEVGPGVEGDASFPSGPDRQKNNAEVGSVRLNHAMAVFERAMTELQGTSHSTQRLGFLLVDTRVIQLS